MKYTKFAFLENYEIQKKKKEKKRKEKERKKESRSIWKKQGIKKRKEKKDLLCFTCCAHPKPTSPVLVVVR